MKKLILILFILFSKNSLAQWQLLNLESGGSIYKAWNLDFINDSIGFAASFIDDWGQGAIWKTTDGALSWTKTNFTNAIKDIYFLNDDSGFAVGNGGKVYRTNNQGVSWDSVNTLSPWWELRSIYFKNANESYIGANITFCSTCTEVLLKSTDGWQTFSSVHLEDTGLNTPDAPVESVHFYNEDTGFVVANGNLWRTIDGGNQWEYNYQIGNQSAGFNEIFKNPVTDKIFLAGQCNVNQSVLAGMLHFTNDFGNFWNEVTLPIPVWGVDSIYKLYDGQFVTGDIGYVCGGAKANSNTDGGIARTTDGGQTWTDENVTGNNGLVLSTVDCPSSQVCYVGGYFGAILKNSNADLGTSIKSISANHNSQLILYPNPVTSIVTIEYQTTNAGTSTVTVENCFGQTLTSLQITNNQKQTIDMSSYASGMYFIKCFDGKQQTVVKVVKSE